MAVEDSFAGMTLGEIADALEEDPSLKLLARAELVLRSARAGKSARRADIALERLERGESIRIAYTYFKEPQVSDRNG